MVHSVRRIIGSANRDKNACGDTGEVRWDSRWRAGDGSIVPLSQ